MKKLRKIATPYSFAETVGVIRRNVLGLDHRDRGAGVQFLPNRYDLTPIIKVDSRIAFLGDIMSVGRRRIIIDESVTTFLSNCEFLVANLEATVTQQRRRKGVLFGAWQWQDVHVLDAMAAIFSPTATYLSVANNHTGDFEYPHYLQSCLLLEERGFNLFGQADRPYVDLKARIRLHAGTMWSNQICKRIHWLGSGKEEVNEQSFNILFPHWGYELEKYPRPEIVNLAKNLCLRFDAIFGHHPHTVQPITAERIGDKTCPIAYSLGDFCSNISGSSYRYGITAKLEMGASLSGDYAAGRIEWRFTECCRREGNVVEVRIADRVPYFEG